MTAGITDSVPASFRLARLAWNSGVTSDPASGSCPALVLPNVLEVSCDRQLDAFCSRLPLRSFDFSPRWSTFRVQYSRESLILAEDRRDCYWQYAVTSCDTRPLVQEPIKDAAQYRWHEVSKVQHYWIESETLTSIVKVSDSTPPAGA
ncbi:MAG: hypothetical protein ABIK62_06315 [candidate division WOR-3 bacterium]